MSVCAKRWGKVRVDIGVEGEVEDSAENKTKRQKEQSRQRR